MSTAARPVFLVGCPRSGTTLLSAMLHGHPRLAMPPETRFLTSVYANRATFGDLREEANRRKLATRITNRKAKFPDLGLDRAATVERIVAAPPTIGSAAGTLWREFARSRGKARWGEKRPAYWRYMDVVGRLFPDAQVIHLVRDGRSCVASLKNVPWWGRGVLGAMTTWTMADSSLRRAGRRLPPGSYHRLRYEDLLADPRGELTRLCTFLGEDFDEGMLDHASAASDMVPERKTWHARIRGDLDRSRAESWRTELTADELGLFETVARRALVRNGYALSGAGERPSPRAVAEYTTQLALRRATDVRRHGEDAVQRRRHPVPLADLGG